MQRHVIFLIIVILFGVAFIVYSKGDDTEAIKYIDLVRARSIEMNEYDKHDPELEKYTKEGILLESSFNDLKVYLSYVEEGCYLTIIWGNLKKEIKMEEGFSYLKWRPNHPSFIYSQFLYDSGGDFGECSLQYVTVSASKKAITLEDKVISPRQADTDLAWSNDGRYYVYSEYSSLRIKDFETGKVWASKLILLDTKKGKVEIKEKQPRELGGFYWTDQDKRIRFLWKSHPNRDSPDGYVEIDVEQIGL